MLKNLAKSAIIAHLTAAIEEQFSTSKEFGDVRAISMIADAVEDLARNRNFTDMQTYELFYEIGRRIQSGFYINDRGRYILDDTEFRRYFERFIGKSGNWKNYERRWNLSQFLRLLVHIPGDLAECGVFEGASAYQMCLFAKDNGRTVHLFDSFEGVSKPDTTLDGSHWKIGDLSASEKVVTTNLSNFDCYKTHKGWIPEAFLNVQDQKFAFLHIDVDLYQPTYDTITFFYERMSPCGIILLDDHGYDTCPGARKAILDFMSDKKEPVLDLSSGQGLIMMSA